MSVKFKRILWLQPDTTIDTFSSNVKGLQTLGANVVSMNYRDLVLNLGIRGARIKLLNVIADFDPDLILASFFSDNYELSPEFLREISSKVSLVIHAGDDEIFGTWQTIYFAQSADAVMTCDYGGRFMYEQLSIPTVYFRSPVLDFLGTPPVVERSIDVSFVGECDRADRSDYIEYLQRNGIKVETYGRGSENGFVSRTDFLKIISKSRITLNFSGRPVPLEILKKEPWRNHFKHLSGRAYEAARMQSFCLSEYCLGLDEMLSIGSEVDVFWDKQELLEKVKYYLKNDAEREGMAAKAFDKVRNEFDDLDYLCRSYNLLHEKLHNKKNRAVKYPVFRSFDFNASEVSANFLIFVFMLRLRKFSLALGVVPYFFSFNFSCMVGLWRGMGKLVSRVLLRR
ncbi:glycosyltransferase [Nitrospinae bacterium]|nr:glycosyltransferase [Nitrospinota bacterium]